MRKYYIRIVYNSCRRSALKTIFAMSEKEALSKFERRYYSRLYRYKSYYVETFKVEPALL